MLFTELQVVNACSQVGPRHGFDAALVAGICRQECQKTAMGLYDAHVVRKEQNYYRKYTMPMDLATTSESLLADSWGVPQMMGLSLFECRNKEGESYFEWYFRTIDQGVRNVIKRPMSQFGVVSALDHFPIVLDVQVEWACLWLKTKEKKALESGDFRGERDPLRKMLLLWNGGGNPDYDDEVLEKAAFLKKKYQL